jgi:hypothetical protein
MSQSPDGQLLSGSMAVDDAEGLWLFEAPVPIVQLA